tara:strand:- start:349 stop:657 length:309 start_codon:yes stop_codon:yes gene_type:complete
MIEYTLDSIKLITANILDDSTEILGLSQNTKNLIRKKMTELLKTTKQFSHISRIDDLVFLLMTSSISKLRIPYNKNKMLVTIQHHISKYRNNNIYNMKQLTI